MPRPRRKPTGRSTPSSKPSNGRRVDPRPAAATEWPDVLTLAEAAAYLRVAEAELERLAGSQGLPARQIGTEWRFSRLAIQHWLRQPSMKQRLLQSAGSWKDDPYLEELLQRIDRDRPRRVSEKRS
jgi:excisionase family DNA binding protein